LPRAHFVIAPLHLPSLGSLSIRRWFPLRRLRRHLPRKRGRKTKAVLLRLTVPRLLDSGVTPRRRFRPPPYRPASSTAKAGGPNPAGRAGDDDITRRQGREAGDVLDQLQGRMDHHVERRGLLDLAVQPRLDLLALEVADFVRRDQEGTERAGAREVLSRRPLR